MLGAAPQTLAAGMQRYSAKAPGPVHAHAGRVRAEVPPPGQAVPAEPADDVPLPADHVPGLEAPHIASDGRHRPRELVADHERGADRPSRPVVPVVDVDVGAADRGLVDPDEDVVDARLRDGDLLQPEARLRPRLDDRPHGRHGLGLPRVTAAFRLGLPNGEEHGSGRALVSRGMVPREAGPGEPHDARWRGARAVPRPIMIRPTPAIANTTS